MHGNTLWGAAKWLIWLGWGDCVDVGAARRVLEVEEELPIVR